MLRWLPIMTTLATLSGCGSVNPLDAPDISAKTDDPKLRAQFAEEYRQRQIAVAAMRNHCREKWANDPAGIPYCEDQQTRPLLIFIASKVMFDALHKDQGLFSAEVGYYARCESAYVGDYEMAEACAENERIVKTLSGN